MTAFMTIDGSFGEGGGQILRSSLALSIITGTPIHIERIRARRKKPGLMRQHLTAVLSAAEICKARVEGAAVGSTTLRFTPGPVAGGEYRFAVGTAGSACLVFQTVLPALLMAGRPSRVVFEGGTHNPMSPPFDFIAKSFLPVLRNMGASVQIQLERPGFAPAGGGRFVAMIEPWTERRAIELIAGGDVQARRARALLSQLRRSIAERELAVIRAELGWDESECTIEMVDAIGPGNVLFCEIERAHVLELVCSFGERGVPAEVVAHQAAASTREYLAADVPVGEHLADQLMIPMALAGGGRYRTLPLSLHAQTNADVITRFLDVVVEVEPGQGGATVSIARRSPA